MLVMRGKTVEFEAFSWTHSFKSWRIRRIHWSWLKLVLELVTAIRSPMGFSNLLTYNYSIICIYTFVFHCCYMHVRRSISFLSSWTSVIILGVRGLEMETSIQDRIGLGCFRLLVLCCVWLIIGLKKWINL